MLVMMIKNQDVDDDDEKKQVKARKLNNLGMGALELVIETSQMINMNALEHRRYLN